MPEDCVEGADLCLPFITSGPTGWALSMRLAMPNKNSNNISPSKISAGLADGRMSITRLYCSGMVSVHLLEWHVSVVLATLSKLSSYEETFIRARCAKSHVFTSKLCQPSVLSAVSEETLGRSVVVFRSVWP